MNIPDADTQIKACNEAADVFVSRYYDAISRKAALETFYVNSTPRYPVPADISINGSVVPTPADYATLLDTQGSGVTYELESYDAHVINPSYQLGCPENLNDNAKAEKTGGKMSIAVTAMGRVHFGKGQNAPQKSFTEAFVLVPNWDAMARNPPRNSKRWLIISQNFRAL
jgi:NTF2-related export protein 1/2